MSLLQILQKLIQETKSEFLKEIKEQIKELIENHISKSSQNNFTEYMTIKEVCSMIKVHKTTLWKYTNDGKLKSYGIGDRVLYKRKEVEEALIQINK